MRPFSVKRYADLFQITEQSASRSLKSILQFYSATLLIEPSQTLAEMATGTRHLSYSTMARMLGCRADQTELLDEWMSPRRHRFHRMFESDASATVRELVDSAEPMSEREIAIREEILSGRIDRSDIHRPSAGVLLTTGTIDPATPGYLKNHQASAD